MPKLSVDIDLIAASGVFARGNENNAHEPDNTYYLGPGSTPAYGIVNIGVRYDLSKWLQLIAQFNNVFDQPVLHGGAVARHGVHEHRQLHRAAVSRGRR